MKLPFYINSRGKLKDKLIYMGGTIAVQLSDGTYAFINTRGVARGKKNVIVGA